MNKFLTTILTISAFLSFAQVPQGINYQGVARDANGIIANQNIGLKFIITNSSNTNVYEETHTPQTNLYGLFTATIGLGAQVGTNSFSVIPWGTGTYFIETQIDPAGGTSYTTLGKQQFMSVPYALYANEAKNINTYSLVTSANTATLIQNGNTNVGTITLTSTPNTTISSSNSNLIVNNPNTNSFALTVPNYSITNGANTNTIVLSNGANSSTVVIPTSTSYTAGTGISISSGSIINTAPNQTVTLTGTGVSGTYPSYTINPSPTTSVAQGNSNITVTQSGNTFSVSAVTPTLSVIGATLSGSYPNQTLTVPTSSTTILTASTNINISGSAPNYIISSPSQSLSLTANTLSLTNSPSVTLPTYSLASNSNSITIYQNGTAINTATISLPASTAIVQGTNNNILVSGSAPNYTISTNTYSLSFPTYSTSSLTNGVNTRTATIPSPPISYANGTLTVGNSSATIPALWQENSGVISPNALANSVSIGTTTSTGGKFEILHSSSAPSPHINLISPTTTDFGKLKFTTSSTTYFSTEARQFLGGKDAAYSISHFNGANEKQVFLINGLRQTYINALNYPLSAFHVMTSAATATGGITSEGFNMPADINITRNNQTSTARTDLAQDNIIGSLNFSGYGGGYGDGAHIYAKASENLTTGKKGTDLIFKTTQNTTSNSVDRMIISNNGNVGIGILNPNSKLHIQNLTNNDGLYIQDYNNGTSLNAVKQNGFTGITAHFQNLSTTNNSSVVEILTSGAGNALNASNTSNTNATIFAKNNNNAGIAGDFDGGLKTYNSGSLASLYAFKSGSANGNVAKFENINSGNTSPAVDISTNGFGAALTLKSGANSITALELVDGHITATQNSGLTVGSSSGHFTIGATGATDIAGSVRTFTPTPIPSITDAAAAIIVTYAKPYVGLPPVVIVTPLSEEFAKLNYWVVSGLSSFTIYYKSTSPLDYPTTNNIEQAFSYHVIGN